MKVEIIQISPVMVIDKALTKCWNSECKTGMPMLKRIDRLVNKDKHASISEHAVITMDITGVSRALLQELARHRIASPTVKSTRYTLEELIDAPLDNGGAIDFNICSDFIVFPRNDLYTTTKQQINHHYYLAKQLIAFRDNKDGLSNDIWKFGLPECYKTDLTWTINMRSLANFLHLRSNKAALWEIRDLANLIFDTLPAEWQYLLKGQMYNYEPEDNS